MRETEDASIFERNLEAFLVFARGRGADDDEFGRLVYEGVTLSDDIRKDLADYLEKEGLLDKPMDPQRFWKQLIFRANCDAFSSYVRILHSHWWEKWHYEGQKLLNTLREYLSQYEQAHERLLTEEEMKKLWPNLLHVAYGVSEKEIPRFILERNLEAFYDYTYRKGVSFRLDCSVEYKGVILSDNIYTDLEDKGADKEPINPKEIWSSFMLDRNIKNFIDYARGKGAVVNSDGSVVYQGVTLTHDVPREVVFHGGDEDLLNMGKLWRHLIFMVNLAAWREYIMKKGVTYDRFGDLVYNGSNLQRKDEVYLKAAGDKVYRRFLSEEELEALWKNFVEITRRKIYEDNLFSWKLFLHQGDLHTDENGYLYYKDKRLPKSAEEYLAQIDEAYKRHLSEKEFEAFLEDILNNAHADEEGVEGEESKDEPEEKPAEEGEVRVR